MPGAAAAALLGSALAASGHPGHVTHVAGHDHWLAALALAVAGALAGLAVLRGLRRRIAAPLPTSKLQAD
ncbi:hypothetical protein EKE94_12655 [Mesobaculum littorinae]|uniref:Uncharacterized protein n=1 Tax=Mesobaculum littorinae TaxID=2486419 RepID=A0A438AG40_9RHOB|nr:hypothetical protein EKE94_12655 [Mesobaculum littorinae]